MSMKMSLVSIIADWLLSNNPWQVTQPGLVTGLGQARQWFCERRLLPRLSRYEEIKISLTKDLDKTLDHL